MQREMPYRDHFSIVDSATYSSSWFAVDQAVQIVPCESTEPEFTGKMIQLSAAAIRLQTDRPLSLELAVELKWKGTVASAKVRKCMGSKSHFLVECGLQSVVRTDQRAAAARTR
jgi:hypothetical protein